MSEARLPASPLVASDHRCVFDDGRALARHAAEWLCALACSSDGAFAVCLAGGSTPQRAYQLLAEPQIASRFPWARVHWFWGDERFVAHDHPESNYRTALQAFLSRVAVPAANIHPIATADLSPQDAASAYEAELRRFHRSRSHAGVQLLFDATLLGIGEDGHTASLFAGQPALDEERHWAVAVCGAAPQPRVTVTYPALHSSHDLAFLVAGAHKRDVLRRVQAGDRALPAARVRPRGRLHWFTDRAAQGQP